MEIGIIGAGWYGCHLALALKRAGHDVKIFEKNNAIFSQVSGAFGIRLHAGPHYPRSLATRKSCHRGYFAFKKYYPELLVDHEYSIYALGTSDADGNSSKINRIQFVKVCEESPLACMVDPKTYGFEEILCAYDIEEPSIVLGERLRSTFKQYLQKANINVRYNFDVQTIQHFGSKVVLKNAFEGESFDKVINATGYQHHMPEIKNFPFEMEVVYQPCLALLYKDSMPGNRPFSFIVMDGWFPCMLPYISEEVMSEHHYLLTHGKWTIMGSYKCPKEAHDVLEKLDDHWVASAIKKPAEMEMCRFWPQFKHRFKFYGWKGEVLAKCRTKREFRSAVTYEKDNIVHIVPGKVSNIFDVEDEVISLLNKENIYRCNDYFFVKGGVMDEAKSEILEKPGAREASTGNLQTYDELTGKKTMQSNVSSFHSSHFSRYMHDDLLCLMKK